MRTKSATMCTRNGGYFKQKSWQLKMAVCGTLIWKTENSEEKLLRDNQHDTKLGQIPEFDKI